MKHIMHSKELDFTIVAEVHDYHVAFTVYDIVAHAEGATKGVFDVPCWPRSGADSSMDTCESLVEAEPYLHGEVKWDRCSNWHFDEQDRCMLHACDKQGLARIGEVMAACWDWASKLLPNWYRG